MSFATIVKTSTQHTITIHAKGGDQVIDLSLMDKQDRDKHIQFLSDSYFKSRS